MPLIESISGIRGVFGDGLDPQIIVRYAMAFGTILREEAESQGRKPLVIVARDGRVTGELCSQLVIGGLRSTGCSVRDAGMATTPTTAMAVIIEGAMGGVILSASHNPADWNALKLLNDRGEFLSAQVGTRITKAAHSGTYHCVRYDKVGSCSSHDYLNQHIDSLLSLDYVDTEIIRRRNFRVVVDGINSVGGIAIPELLRRVGISQKSMHLLNCNPTGHFAHNPEPLPSNVGEAIRCVQETGADIGIVVDPDADRLALIADGGVFFGEELTQVIATDFILGKKKGPVATNLSSSRAIEVIAEKHGQKVFRSAVGEINVVEKMKETGAVIGGEGNGGVILPDLHYGRDAMVGTVLALQYLAEKDCRLSEVKSEYPALEMSKQKVPLGNLDPDEVIEFLADKYRKLDISTIDGLKIDLEEGWVHMRKSNTEPILRVYSEADTLAKAEELANRYVSEIREFSRR